MWIFGSLGVLPFSSLRGGGSWGWSSSMWPALCSKVFIHIFSSSLFFFCSKSLPFLSVSQLLFGLCWLLFFPPSSVFLAFIPFGIYFFLGFLFPATATATAAALCFPRCLSLGNLYAMCVFVFFGRCYAGSLARLPLGRGRGRGRCKTALYSKGMYRVTASSPVLLKSQT